MDYHEELADVIREAFAALQGSHPEVMARIAAVVEAASGDATDSKVQEVEAAFRDAGKTLLATDKAGAQTLFTVAESLAEISSHWGLPRDLL